SRRLSVRALPKQPKPKKSLCRTNPHVQGLSHPPAYGMHGRRLVFEGKLIVALSGAGHEKDLSVSGITGTGWHWLADRFAVTGPFARNRARDRSVEKRFLLVQTGSDRKREQVHTRSGFRSPAYWH